MKTALTAWFGVSTFAVASLIVLGGVTRLTRSGLSMTDWKFTGRQKKTKTPHSIRRATSHKSERLGNGIRKIQKESRIS